ncbi:hypothetical protein [Pseudomonas viridiflava]|uniref:hypothetical protein n=1 Tax=Pseudomonas viridiflava TaxID=33069 RepID=UPI000F02453B|nr:hypothetical protein [Pseudomonas viridiflava]
MKTEKSYQFIKKYGYGAFIFCTLCSIAALYICHPIKDSQRFNFHREDVKTPNLVTYAPIQQMLSVKDQWSRSSSQSMCVSHMGWCLLRALDDDLRHKYNQYLEVPAHYVEAGVSDVTLVGYYGTRGMNRDMLTILAVKKLRGDGQSAFLREVGIAAKRVGSMPIFIAGANPVYRKWVMASGGLGGEYTFKDPTVSSLVRFDGPARSTWLGLYQSNDGPFLAIVNKPSNTF